MDNNVPVGKKSDGTKYKVLIIDDSIFVVKQIKKILEAEDFEIIDVAEDGQIGFEKYKKYYPNIDIVTMDITMPKLDGISSLEKIIEFDRNAKVIIISALGKEDLVKKALLSGAKNYIVKPLDRVKVIERIISVLNGV